MSVGSEGFASPSTSSLPCARAAANYHRFCLFSYLTVQDYKDHVNNVNISSLGCELFDSYSTRTPVCLAQFSHKTRLPSSGQATKHQGLPGNALSTTPAFPAVNTATQASSLKWNFALESPPIKKNFTFKLCKIHLSWFTKICMSFASVFILQISQILFIQNLKETFGLKSVLLCCFYI